MVSVFLPALEQVSKTEAILESRLLTVEMREAEDVDLMDSRIEGIEETLQEMARLVSGLKKKVQKNPLISMPLININLPTSWLFPFYIFYLPWFYLIYKF